MARPDALHHSHLRRGDLRWGDLAGSTGATLATLALLGALAWVVHDSAPEPDPEPLVFTPGALLALGDDADAPPGGDSQSDVMPEPDTSEPDTPETPADAEDAVADANADVDAVADADADADTLTDDDVGPSTRLPSDEPKPAGGKPKPSGNPSGKPSGNPSSLLPKPLPGVQGGPTRGGSASGTPDGFTDRLADGDPWATDVLAALSRAPVGTFGGDLPAGTFRFKLSICPDGRIKRVKRRGGSSITDDGADRVELAIEKIKLPRPPSDVRTAMAGKCTALDYTFAWTASGVE